MEISGTVSSRTNGRRGAIDAPSESQILELNPSRKSKILSCTNWVEVAEGTLNLKVLERDFEQLTAPMAIFIEKGIDVVYPTGWSHIPKMREEYWYFKATLNNEAVLVRRAKIPHSKSLIEVFAENKLRDKLGLKDNDLILLTF
ncbi:TPA: DUF120 domain-containing protein [Vibrio alginolyticus]|uniref:DUF120 domain-containing protein n=1 Tax=Vibrio TaxID=662 RepID=UPI0006D28DCD|nr:MULTISPECIES: DUF120 domain-containing protein [Vibrio]MDW1809646.1 DUF120 domain-containing protein [Vibrio sp. Vb2362]EGQ9235547.1 DUF120 domain-containing protein [Vibrio alginolyticus]EGR0713370.1 DUF120 domain-containing protein [Vibrio alginolyticus]EGR2325582.1 DUF120 domain-containing protein [Vibrio alginolyticus]ELA7571794.1 DUF120 domain-containing protein [Vibrio alginolyticus]